VRRRPRRRLPVGPRHLLRRHPLVYWTAVAILVVTTGVVVSSMSREAEVARQAFGDLERVPVARRTLAAGERIGAGDVEWRELPARLVSGLPPDEVVDQVVSATIYAGEPIVAPRLAPDGAGAVAARVPAGRHALAVPVTVGSPAVEVGDVVDLLAVATPDPSGPAPERVARRAPVVDVTDEAVTVAVDADEVRSTAFALGTGAVVIVLTSPR
jgi:Flp pilus assembly protein CpaB